MAYIIFLSKGLLNGVVTTVSEDKFAWMYLKVKQIVTKMSSVFIQ